MQLKSFLARVTRDGSRYKVLVVALNDGTPLKSVEVRVDDGPWQAATLDPATNSKYSWKLYTYTWNNPTPGEHTLVSRVTDVNGNGAADRRGPGGQEEFPRGQLAGAAEGYDLVRLRDRQNLDVASIRRHAPPRNSLSCCA